MTHIYSSGDLENAKNQKKKCLIFFFVMTAVYVLVAAGIFIYFLFEPYGSKKETWLLVSECVISAIYAVFAYIFMTIRLSRVRNYCIMLGRALTRKPTAGTATFMHFNSDITTKDKCDFKSMTLVEWSDKEKDYMERYILIDPEKPRPDFRAGDELSFETYSNVLVSYTINNRTDLVGTPFGDNA